MLGVHLQLVLGVGGSSPAHARGFKRIHQIETGSLEQSLGVSGVDFEGVETASIGIHPQGQFRRLTEAVLLDQQRALSGRSLLERQVHFQLIAELILRLIAGLIGRGLPFCFLDLAFCAAKADLLDADTVVGMQVEEFCRARR